ncbi:hypothetical protein JB92DRAFT_3131402 [Gautieria morchelliformis]|nr:hypothetical protein JB92DRAFT_3131402 [Gautieria morchelliformis]
MISEVYEARGKNSPDRPLLLLEGVQAMPRATRIVGSHSSRCKLQYISQKLTNDVGPGKIVPLGWTPFPISTRNSSPPAIPHLISNMGVFQLFLGPDPAMQRLSQDSLDLLELFPGMEGKRSAPVAIQPLQIDRPGVILHSSGKPSFHYDLPCVRLRWRSEACWDHVLP